MTKPQRPANLHPEAVELLLSIEQEYAFDGLLERPLLRLAVGAFSIALKAAQIVADEGLFIKTARGGGLKKHPAIAVQRDAEATFTALMKALGLAPDRRRRTVVIPGARNRLGGRFGPGV